MSDLSFLGFVPMDHNFPTLGEFSPVGSPPHVILDIAQYGDLPMFSQYLSFIPIAGTVYPYDDDHGWCSNGSSISVAQAWEPVWRVRRMKLSMDITITDNGYGVDTSTDVVWRTIHMVATKIFDPFPGTESDLPNFRGFAYPDVELFFADFDSVTGHNSVGDGSGGVTITSDNYSADTDPIFVINIGHLLSGAMDNSTECQVHSYFTSSVIDDWNLTLGSQGLLGEIITDSGATLQIRMTGWHSYDLKLRTDNLTPVDRSTRANTYTASGYIQLEPATGETDAFWGYDGKYDTTTGAAL